MKLLSFLLLLIPLFSAFAAEKIIKSEQFTETISDGENVLKFNMRTEAKELLYNFSDGKPYYMTKMVASLQTKKSENLKEYGVVQFIRGCIFKSKKNVDDTVTRSIDTVRQFFNGEIPFKHPEWVLDSVDLDPIYWSSIDPKYGRIGLYRLDDPMSHQEPQNQLFIYKHLKEQKKYFVRDMPTGASEYEGEYQNVSLEFKTCLYRLSDVPEASGPIGVEIQGKELKCFDWSSNFIFDFTEQKYKMEKEIHPFCLNP